MLKIGLILLLGFGQTQITQDSLGLEVLIQEQRIENQLLEREIELLEDHVREIRNTVWFSLGIVATVLLSFVFYNWFTTNRIHEHERESLKKEFEIRFGKELSRTKEMSYSLLSIVLEFFNSSLRSKRDSDALQQAHHFVKIYDDQDCEHDLLLKTFLKSLKPLMSSVKEQRLENSLPDNAIAVIGDQIIDCLRSINEKRYAGNNGLINEIVP